MAKKINVPARIAKVASQYPDAVAAPYNTCNAWGFGGVVGWAVTRSSGLILIVGKAPLRRTAGAELGCAMAGHRSPEDPKVFKYLDNLGRRISKEEFDGNFINVPDGYYDRA